MEQIEIIKILQDKLGEAVLRVTPFPKAYCKNIEEVKAIYLGCDPSNQHSQNLPYAFALESELNIFNSFIKSHEKNLNCIGLSWDNVYVQNLCQNYFKEETSKNFKVWKAAANMHWIEHLKNELDSRFKPEIPVFLTSQYLLDVLADSKWARILAPEFYECIKPIPIPANENKLNRPLIPMYRGKSKLYDVSYHLKYNKWENYRLRINNVLNNNI